MNEVDDAIMDFIAIARPTSDPDEMFAHYREGMVKGLLRKEEVEDDEMCDRFCDELFEIRKRLWTLEIAIKGVTAGQSTPFGWASK